MDRITVRVVGSEAEALALVMRTQRPACAVPIQTPDDLTPAYLADVLVAASVGVGPTLPESLYERAAVLLSYHRPLTEGEFVVFTWME